MPVFLGIAQQSFDFKNSIIAIQLFLAMILNLYVASERSQSKRRSNFVMAVLKNVIIIIRAVAIEYFSIFRYIYIYIY